jgi:hypothetical protein
VVACGRRFRSAAKSTLSLSSSCKLRSDALVAKQFARDSGFQPPFSFSRQTAAGSPSHQDIGANWLIPPPDLGVREAALQEEPKRRYSQWYCACDHEHRPEAIDPGIADVDNSTKQRSR